MVLFYKKFKILKKMMLLTIKLLNNYLKLYHYQKLTHDY